MDAACCICFGESDAGVLGAFCCAGHFTCSVCLDGAVNAAVDMLATVDNLATKAARAKDDQDARLCAKLCGQYSCLITGI